MGRRSDRQTVRPADKPSELPAPDLDVISPSTQAGHSEGSPDLVFVLVNGTALGVVGAAAEMALVEIGGMSATVLRSTELGSEVTASILRWRSRRSGCWGTRP